MSAGAGVRRTPWCATWMRWRSCRRKTSTQRAVVVVATIQSFRVEDTDQRNVYAFSEKFEPHFRGEPARAG
jgi:hypothetical protein